MQKVVFVENAGQFKTSDGKAAPHLLFKVETQGLNIYITTKGLTYFFVKPKTRQSESSKTKINKDSLDYEYHRFDIDLQNATIKKENIVKEEASSVNYNYFYPHCKQGVSGVKEYGKLTIKNVYPGIDWVLYSSSEKGLKYDFIVHAGVDPNQINFIYKSLNPVNLKEGTISVNTSFGNFIDNTPKCFLQKTHSVVNSKYTLKSKVNRTIDNTNFYETEVGFNIDHYPKDETLIIDPLQQWWGTYYGGGISSAGTSVTTDSLGNLYVLGNTNSLDIPLHPYGSLAYFQGIYGGNNNGGGLGDLFILKFTNIGQLLWATYLGGQNIDNGEAIKCDNLGNFFVFGETYSLDMPLKKAGSGAYYDSINGVSDWLPDLFLAKFSNNGQYLWGTYYGGNDREQAGGISIDKYNDVYFTGYTTSLNFPVYDPGGSAFFQGVNGVSSGGLYDGDALILKFSNSGQRKLATYFGGDGDDKGISTDCDSFGNVYFCGAAASANLYTKNPGGGAFYYGSSIASGGNYNGFILKLNSNCNPIWSTYISALTGVCNSIICDKSGNVFIAGRFFGPGFPAVNPGGGAFSTPYNQTNLAIAKFNPLSQMVWGTYFGTWGTYGNAKLTLGSCEEVYVTTTVETNCAACAPMQIMNPGNGAYYDSTYNDDYHMSLSDVFIAAFTNSGMLKWGTYFGGIGNDANISMTCDKKGNLFYTGFIDLSYYYTPTFLQTYTSGCIKDPGSGTYFQNLLNAPPFPANEYCVIGKFTNPYPSVNLSTSGCSNNDSIIAQTYSGWAPYHYSWSNGDTTNSITNIPAGSYTCTITDGFLGCEQKQQIYFGIPSISVSALSDSICLNQSTQLNAQGANIYNWLPNTSLNAPSGSSVLAHPNTTTNYTVTGVTSSNCSSTNTITVIVNPLPTILVSGIDSICNGAYSSINATGAANYTWYPNVGLNTLVGNNVIANPNQTQTYFVIGTNNHHCTDTASFKLNIISLPQLQIIGTKSICIGNTTSLTAIGADQFSWNYGSNNFLGSIAEFSPTVNTTYTLLGINGGKCKDSLAFTINIFQLPKISIQATDSICDGEEFKIQAAGNGTFNWYPSNGLSCSQCANPTATLRSSALYIATITDINSCSNKDSVYVIVNESCGETVLIPNVFSPNSDGINDLFKITVSNIRSFECDIFDRWGIKLFNSTNYDSSWNGTTPNGGLASVGTYFYIVRIKKYNNQVKEFKGYLSLFR